MKKNIILICCLTLFLFATVSICYAFDFKAVKDLKKHPDFVSIEQAWFDKLGGHFLVKLKENRILEFSQINLVNGGGKYAQLRRINEFEVRGSVNYPKDSSTEEHWKDCYGSDARFRDLSKGMGIKIGTMVDVINHYDEVLAFIKMIGNEQYISGGYAYHVDTEDRKATIYVAYLNGYPDGLWHGIKEDEIPFNEDWGEWWCVSEYGENWREKLNADLPKIRKALGLEN